MPFPRSLQKLMANGNSDLDNSGQSISVVLCSLCEANVHSSQTIPILWGCPAFIGSQCQCFKSWCRPFPSAMLFLPKWKIVQCWPQPARPLTFHSSCSLPPFFHLCITYKKLSVAHVPFILTGPGPGGHEAWTSSEASPFHIPRISLSALKADAWTFISAISYFNYFWAATKDLMLTTETLSLSVSDTLKTNSFILNHAGEACY